MHHIHLLETPSTQDEVKKALKEGAQEILISTDHQIAGRGRQGAKWVQFNDALAFSFTLKPNENLTLTPLEVGVHLANFFSSKVFLKWPNDLLNESGQKLGGILCQLVGNTVVVGIGLNLKTDKASLASHDFPYAVAGLFEESSLDSNIRKELPLKIVNFVLSNRLTKEEVEKEFLRHCLHKNKNVVIESGNDIFKGSFVGINADGAALIVDSDQQEKAVLTGSLTFQ